MAYPAYTREKARQLRVEKKLTIDELADRLAIPRTTIYYWVRDLPVPRDPATMRACAVAAARANKRKHQLIRAAAYERGRAEFAELIREPTFRDFVCMYIGEGYKRNRNVVSIGNSDPAVMLLATHWINRLSVNRVTLRLQYHQDQDPEQLRTFWCERLSFSPDALSYQRKSNSGKLSGRTWRSKYGVLTVQANDTLLRARLQAWIDQVQKEWLHSPNGA